MPSKSGSTPSIGFELEEAVGKRIYGVRQDPDNPLGVMLELYDGSTLELIQRPADADKRGSARTIAPTVSVGDSKVDTEPTDDELAND